jgi:hypothetical protein
MPQYDFVSPGDMGRNRLEQFLVQRELQQRQRMIDAQKQQEAEAQLRQRDEEIALRRESEARQGKAQEEQMAGLEDERKFRRASTIHTNALPGVIDPATADLLKTQGFGSIVKQGQPTQGAFLGEDEQSIPQYDVIPGVLETSGGTAYQQARAAEAARAEQAQGAQAAAAERAAADREAAAERAREGNATRETIARVGAGNASASRGLQDQLTQLRIEAETAKQEATRAEQGRNAKAFTDAAQTTLSLIDRLEQHPGVARITGNMEMLGWTQPAKDAAAIRDQLIASLTLPNLGTLKGPMSDKDVQFVKQLATRLSSPGISEQEFRQAITEAKTKLSGGGEMAAAPGGARRGRYNPATGQIEY